MGKEYVVKEFDARSGIFREQITNLYREIADYANKNDLKIIKVSDMDKGGTAAVIFEKNSK